MSLNVKKSKKNQNKSRRSSNRGARSCRGENVLSKLKPDPIGTCAFSVDIPSVTAALRSATNRRRASGKASPAERIIISRHWYNRREFTVYGSACLFSVAAAAKGINNNNNRPLGWGWGEMRFGRASSRL